LRRADIPRPVARRLALAVIGLSLAGWIGFLAIIVPAESVDDTASGRLVAVFPPGPDRGATLDRLARIDARIVRDSTIPFVLTLFDNTPGFASRLRAAGAIGVFHGKGVIRCITGDF